MWPTLSTLQVLFRVISPYQIDLTNMTKFSWFGSDNASVFRPPHKHTGGCTGWSAVNMNNSGLHIDTTAAPGKAMLDLLHTRSRDGGTGRQTRQDDPHTDSISYLTLRCLWKPGDGVGGPGVHGHFCPAVGCEPQYTCAECTHTPATSTGNPCLKIDRTQGPFFLFVCFLSALCFLSLGTHQHDHVTLWRQTTSVCGRTRVFLELMSVSFSPNGRQWERSTQTAEDPSRKWTSEFDAAALFSFFLFS